MVTAEATTPHQTMRTMGLVAGIALLAMAILAGFANFGVIEQIVTDGDAAKTAQDILASQGLFRAGVASLALVAVLDVIVAWALLVLFTPVHNGIASLAAWFRVVYAGVFLVAISQLVGVVPLVGDAGYVAAYSTEQRHAEALLKINAFQDIWNAGLILFGIHLLLLGYLAYTADFAPKWLGVVLAIAGLGYLVDSFGTQLVPDYSISVAMVTFVGEVLLMIWLLIKSRSITANDTVHSFRHQ